MHLATQDAYLLNFQLFTDAMRTRKAHKIGEGKKKEKKRRKKKRT
jgi:hypothetical protein